MCVLCLPWLNHLKIGIYPDTLLLYFSIYLLRIKAFSYITIMHFTPKKINTISRISNNINTTFYNVPKFPKYLSYILIYLFFFKYRAQSGYARCI